MNDKSAKSTVVDFLEDLPERCPPSSASDIPHSAIYRLVSNIKASADDFKSHAALGKENKTRIDPCKWASCSLVKDPDQHVKRWPRLQAKDNFFAELHLEEGCGLSHGKKSSNHVDFWAFSGFDFDKCITDVRLIRAEKQEN